MLNGFVKGFGVSSGVIIGLYTGIKVVNYLAKTLPKTEENVTIDTDSNSNSEKMEEPQ